MENPKTPALYFPHSPEKGSHVLNWNPLEFGIYTDASDREGLVENECDVYYTSIMQGGLQ